MELIFAIRADDEGEVRRLLAGSDVEINAHAVVEGTKVRNLSCGNWHNNFTVFVQVTLYTTHALFEAARRGNENIVRMILQRHDLDVNLPAVCASVILSTRPFTRCLPQTAINISTLADACNRQDLKTVEILLDDPRVNPHAGSDEVPLALQYAVRNGSLEVLRAFERRGHITVEQEDVLMATAQKYDQGHIVGTPLHPPLPPRAAAFHPPPYRLGRGVLPQPQTAARPGPQGASVQAVARVPKAGPGRLQHH